MASNSNQGFAAIVSAVERLRDATYSTSNKRQSINRPWFREEQEQTKVLRAIDGGLSKSSTGSADQTLRSDLAKWFATKRTVTLPSGRDAILSRQVVARDANTKKFVSTKGLQDPAGLSELERKFAAKSSGGGVGKTSSMSPGDIEADPKRFQYKLVSNANTGASGSLKGITKDNWDSESAGVITVWKDPQDGKFYVINGHNRLAKVKEVGIESVNVLEIAAKDAKEARAKGALQNIREGQGTLLDAADFFRQSGIKDVNSLKKLGVPLSQKKAEMGIGIASLPGDLYTKTLTGDIPQERAALIGGSGLDEQKQREILALAEKQKLSNDKLASVIDDIKAQTMEQQVISVGLFDDFVNGILERAELITAIEKRLDSQLKLLRQVSDTKKSKFVQVEGIGSLDANKAKKLYEDVDTASNVFGSLKNQDQYVSGMISKGGRMIATGQDKDPIEDNSTKIVRAVSPLVNRGEDLATYDRAELSEAIKSLVNEKGTIDPVVFDLTSSFPDNFQDELFEINRQIEAGMDINSGNQAGINFGENFIDGLQQSLLIASPSKKAQELAEYFVQGWVIGLSTLGVATDKPLEEQTKKFRQGLRKAIIESRERGSTQPRDKSGRFISQESARKREQANEQPRNRRGQFVANNPIQEQIQELVLEVQNLSVRANIVNLTAGAINLTTKDDSPARDNRLAKAIADQIRSKPLEVKTSLLGKLTEGITYGFGNQLVKGFDRGTKKNIGIDSESVGYGIGNFATNPKKATKEGVSWRRKLELDNSLAMAQRQALEEDVSIKEGKEKVFVVGGTVGKKGKGGSYAKRTLQNSGFRDADLEMVENPYTDSDVNPSEDLMGYQLSTYSKHIQNKVIRGYNPDAVNLAAKVIAAKKKDPKANISMVGHSGGSDVVEEAIAILERGGYNDVRGIGAGAMEMGVGYGTKGYNPMLGKKDMFSKNPIMGPMLEPNTENFRGFSQLDDHHFDNYIAHPDFVKNISEELQPEVVKKLLEQHYKEIIEKSAKEFEEAIEGLPATANFFPIAEQLQKDYFAFLQNAVKDAEAFAGEFNASFSDEKNAPINAILEKYQAVKEQVGGRGAVTTLKAKANTQKPAKVSESLLDISPISQAISELVSQFGGLAEAIARLRALIEGTTPTEETPLEARQTQQGQQPRQSLAEPIRNRLTGVVEESRQSAQERMATLIPNFGGMAPNARREKAGQYYEGWKGKVQQYRKLITEKKADLASQLAEEILTEGESLYKAFGDMAAKDKSLAGSFGGFRSYISNVRGEIAGKQTDQGFQPGSMESLVGQLESSGDNAVGSMLDAIAARLGEVNQAGQDIGDTLAGGTQDSLGIQSPSKVFRAIGKDIIAGLMQGMDGFEGTLEEKEKILETYVKSVIELIYNFKKVTGKPMGEADKVRKLFQEIGREGQATPKQLQEAQKYFPQVERMEDDSPSVALYNPKRNVIKVKQGRQEDKLFQDLVHEYTHALQARFGVGQRFSKTPADYFPKTAISPKGEKFLGDRRVDQASDASAEHLMGAFNLTPEQGKRYDVQYNHVKRREAEAYSNELGAKEGKERRGFFLADADKIAAEIKAKRQAIKDAVDGVRDEIGRLTGKNFFHGTTKAGAKSIRQGIDVTKAIDTAYGQGFYLTDDMDEAKTYGEEVLKAKVNVKNPWVTTSGDYNQFIQQSRKSGQLKDPDLFADDYDAQLKQFAKDKTELVKSQGYDSVFLQDKGFLVAFEAQQVEVEKGSTGLVDALRNAGAEIQTEINKLKTTIAKDLEYFRAVATGDTAKAQAMVEQAAKGSGYNVGPVYHGTDKEFNEFKIRNPSEFLRHRREEFSGDRFAAMFTTKKDYAATYGDNIKEVHLKAQKNKYSSANTVQGLPYAYSTAEESKYFHEKGYDSAFFGSKDINKAKEIGVFNPNQIKSADPVTKTDSGVPVPLSARFDDSVADIRGNVTDIFAGLKAQAGESLQPLISELETRFAEIGDNSIDSLIASLQGSLDQLRAVGGDVGTELIESVQESLGIQSPSKVFRAIGKDIIAGLMQGMDGFDGTLEEKEKILETYVKSVIELIYNFKKVTGKPMGEADKVRKLFQEIGKEGQANPKQLQEAQKYFPQVERMPDDSPGVALYNPKRNAIKIKQGRTEDQLFQDLVHEYTHALQARFGVGQRFARTPADYFPKTAISAKGAKHLEDPRVERGADASAEHLMGAFNLTPEQGKRYDVQYNHVKRREAEAYSNELGAKEGKDRRGFFLADADKIAEEIKAKRQAIKDATQELTEEIKEQAEQVSQAGEQVGEKLQQGLEAGQQKAKDFLTGFLDFLENIPILGQLVKFGRMIAGVAGGLFNMIGNKAKPKQPATTTAKPKTIPIQWEEETTQSKPEAIAKPEVVTATPPKPVQIEIEPEEVAQQVQEIIEPVTQIEVEPVTIPEPTPIDIAEETTTAIAESIDPKAQADRWVAYLHQWAKGIGDALDASIVEEIKQLKASGQNVAQAIRGKIDAVGEGLDDKTARFRQAVKDGNKELTVALGKELMRQSTEMRVLFKRMAENVKFMEGRGMWKDQAWQMTMLQNETVRGYPKMKGRADEGAWQAIGQNVDEGFAQGIEADLSEAEQSGMDLGEAAIKGAKKSLGIKSPSQEFIEIAQMVIEGWEQGLEALGDGAGNNVRRFTRSVDEALTEGVDRAQGLIGDMFGQILEQFPIIKQVGLAIAGFFAAFALEEVLKSAVSAFATLANASFDAVVQFESLNRAFVALTGSSTKAKAELKSISAVAKELGIDLATAEQAKQGLIATTRGTALEGTQTDELFYSFAQTASVRGLSNEEQGRMFAAIQQMLGKQKVSAEEVRGQLGEIAGLDFQGTLARSMGVGVAQLDEAMSSGQLMAADVLPKVAAQYAAENAVVSNSAETTAQAIARYNNAILEMQRSMASWFDEVKVAINIAAGAIDLLTKMMPGLIQAVSALGLVLAWNSVSVVQALLRIGVVSKIATAVLTALGKAIGYIFSAQGLKLIGGYAAQLLLVQLAMDAVYAAFNAAKDPFEEYTKSIQKTQKALEELKIALDDTGKAAATVNLPTNAGDVVSKDTWKLFGVDTKLNLEPVRQAMGIREDDGIGSRIRKTAMFGPLAWMTGTTLGEKRMNDFTVKGGDDAMAAYGVLQEDPKARKAVEETIALQKKLDEVRFRASQQNLAGDRRAYEATIKEEKELLKQLEESNKKTASYQQAISSAIESTKQGLADLETLRNKGEITGDRYNSEKQRREALLADLEEANLSFGELTNTLATNLTRLGRELRNLEEGMTAFNEQVERSTRANRIAFLQGAAGSGTGSAVRGIGLEQIGQSELQARIQFGQSRLNYQRGLLADPEWTAIANQIQQEIAGQGLEVNSASLQRIIQERQGSNYAEVAQLMADIRATEDELAGYQEQVAQSVIDMDESLFGLNRQIADFFQQLSQQIVEAQVELERQTMQLRNSQIKQKLQRVLVPGSDGFINSVVSQIQGLFDQAFSVMDSVLGQKSARFQFTSEKYSLENQMEDFRRSVQGATDALTGFTNALGGQSPAQSGAVATNRNQATGRSATTGGGTQSFFPVVTGKIGTSRGQKYGASRDGGKRKHRGVDIEARPGEPVHAVVGGTIKEIKMWDSKVNSHKIVVVGTDGIRYVYGHVVPKSGLKVNDVVGNGAQIATISQKDRLSTAPHLHFEAWKNGQSYDPTSQIASLPRPTSANLQRAQSTASAQPQQRQATPAASTSSQSNVARQSLEKLLKRFGSKMTPEDFYWVSQQTGVSVDALVTQAMIESGFGTKGRGATYRNPLNWGNDDAGNNRGFPTMREGLLAGARGLKENFNFTTPEQFIANGFRGKYGIYATDPQYKTKYQKALNQVRSAGIGATAPATAQTVAQTTTTPRQSSNDPIIQQAQALTNQLIQINEQRLAVGDQQVVQQVVDYFDSITRGLAQIKFEQGEATLSENERQLAGMRQLQNLFDQYTPDTLYKQDTQAQRQLDDAIFAWQADQYRRITNYQASIESINRFTEQIKSGGEIEQIVQTMTPDQQKLIKPIIDPIIDQFGELTEQTLLPIKAQLEEGLRQATEQSQQVEQLKSQAEKFNQQQQAIRENSQAQALEQLKSQIAQDSRDLAAIRDSAIETARLDANAQILQAQQEFFYPPNAPEEIKTDYDAKLKERIGLIEQQNALRVQGAIFDFESAIAQRALKQIAEEITQAEYEGNEARKLQLTLQQLQLEYDQERAEIQREITDETARKNALDQAGEKYWRGWAQAQVAFQDAQIARAERDLDLQTRYRENAASLERNPFTAATMRESLAMDQANEEFRKKEAAIMADPTISDPAEKARMIAKEYDILQQRLTLIDREFLDLTETIGMGVAGAFNSFFSALINGQNALQAFGQSLMNALVDIGSQMITSGVNSLIGGIFGFSEGGYTGSGGKYQPAGIVHAGEFVINKESTSKIGVRALDALNRWGELPGYFKGGLVASEERLLQGLNSLPSYSVGFDGAIATTANNNKTSNRNTTIKIEQNFNAPVDRFNASANTLAREQAEALRRAMR